MKYLLIISLALVVFWLWRNKRRDEFSENARNSASKRQPTLAATEIVACDVCHVHLPRTEALMGPDGVYCSAAHRQQADR